MNDRFYELPEEKQLAIFNASKEVFGENDYKRASTDLIAKKAGISKGMLFYYWAFFSQKEEVTDGYLHTKQMTNTPLSLSEIEKEYEGWVDMFKKIAYKEEFQ